MNHHTVFPLRFLLNGSTTFRTFFRRSYRSRLHYADTCRPAFVTLSLITVVSRDAPLFLLRNPSADSFFSHTEEIKACVLSVLHWKPPEKRCQYTSALWWKSYHWPSAVSFSFVWAFLIMVNSNKCNSLCVYSSLYKDPTALRTLWSTNPPLLVCQKRSLLW